MLRALRRLAALLAAFVLLLLAGAAGLLWSTLPGGDRTVAIPGLSAPARVEIDPDGIPRVRAGTEADAAAVLGLLHARERMAQMELMRRAASGELSEIVGAATLPVDRMMRTLGLRRRAEADLAALPAEARALLDAYARGVNAWIAERGRLAAAEFLLAGTPRPWSPVDSLLWGKTMGIWLSGNWRNELARLGLAGKVPDPVIDALWPAAGGPGRPEAALPPAAGEVARRLAALLPAFPAPFTLPSTASNAWAVDGRYSGTGAPLLAGDPHLGFGLPGVWYLARIETPAGVRAGATAPGVPMLVIGHNGRIAWSFTTTGADTQDLFVETPAGPDAYLTPDGPRPYETREERIRVRGQPDELLVVRETRHGPVVSDLVGRRDVVLALAAANLAPGDTAAAGLMALNRAGSVAEAGQAAAMITAPVQNMTVADREGIGLFVTGTVPIRRAGDGSRPVPGADGAHDWTGFASGAALPRVVAPASGRVVNANERIAPPDFPVFLGRDWFDDARARRIRELLDAPGRPGLADFAAMQVDAVDLVARDLLPRLRAVAPADDLSARALALLAGWEGDTAIDLAQPVIFNAWMQRLHRDLLAGAGVPPGAEAAAAPWTTLLPFALSPAGGVLCGGDCTKLLAPSLAAAMADLAGRLGADPAAWRWGTAHPAVFSHPILRPIPVIGPASGARIATPGDDSTLFRAGMRGGSLEAVHGAAFRVVADLDDLERSLFVVAPGQSGHVLSRLARNFLPRWRDGGMVALAGRARKVEVRLDLVPGASP